MKRVLTVVAQIGVFLLYVLTWPVWVVMLVWWMTEDKDDWR